MEYKYNLNFNTSTTVATSFDFSILNILQIFTKFLNIYSLRQQHGMEL